MWHALAMERGKARLERLRRRRKEAVELFEQGERRATIAHSLRVSRQSASEWWLAWHIHDTKKLERAIEAGRKPRLTQEQLELVETELLQGAVQGYETDLWSLPQIAELIQKLTVVGYYPGHVWKILCPMEWSLQGRLATVLGILFSRTFARRIFSRIHRSRMA